MNVSKRWAFSLLFVLVTVGIDSFSVDSIPIDYDDDDFPSFLTIDENLVSFLQEADEDDFDDDSLQTIRAHVPLNYSYIEQETPGGFSQEEQDSATLAGADELLLENALVPEDLGPNGLLQSLEPEELENGASESALEGLGENDDEKDENSEELGFFARHFKTILYVSIAFTVLCVAVLLWYYPVQWSHATDNVKEYTSKAWQWWPWLNKNKNEESTSSGKHPVETA